MGTAVLLGVIGCRGPYTRNLMLMSKAEAGEDLDVLVEGMKAIHPALYHRTPEGEFEREVAEARGQLHDGMERREVEWLATRLTAVVGDGHTGVSGDGFAAYREGGGVAFPLWVEADGVGGLKVRRVPAKGDAAAGVEVGMRLLEVDGEPVGEMVRRYRGYVSADDDRRKDEEVAWRFEGMMWHEKGARKAFWVRVADREGRERTVRVRAVTRAEMSGEEPKASQGEGGKREVFPYRFYEGGRVCVMEARSFDYQLEGEWVAAVNRILGEMRGKGTKLLVLDMRWNPGGDSGLPTLLVRCAATRPVVGLAKEWRYSWAYRHGMMVYGLHQRGIPSWLWLDYVLPLEWFYPTGVGWWRVGSGEWIRAKHWQWEPIDGGWKGDFAVWVNRGTYSAAVDAAALVKDNHIGVVVGEETGGHASEYTDIGMVLLPNSGVAVRVATAFVTRPAGFDDGKGVLPDVEVGGDAPVEEWIERTEEGVRGKGR